MMEQRAQKASAPSRRPVLRLASAGDVVCRTLGGSIDLPRLDGQRGADAVSSSADLVMQPPPPLRLRLSLMLRSQQK